MIKRIGCVIEPANPQLYSFRMVLHLSAEKKKDRIQRTSDALILLDD